MIDLSIVIVNWNTRDLLAQCLQSVYETVRELEFEVFVVDNASSDGSTTMVKKEFPQVKLIENNENVGFARANNQAIAQSQGRYVLLLNSDTLVLPGAIDRVVAFMDQHWEVGAAGCAVLNPDGTLQLSHKTAFSIGNELVYATFLGRFVAQRMPFPKDVLQHGQKPFVSEYLAVDAVSGAFLLVRREVMDEVGLLDERFFIYSEDDDWCFRIRQAGWQICYLLNVRIIHYGGQSTRQESAEMFLQLYKNRFLFYRKNYGQLKASFLKWVFIAEAWVKLAAWAGVYLSRLGRRAVARERIWALWRLATKGVWL